MQTLIVKIDTANHAAQVTDFLKTIPYIKSVIAEPRKTSDSLTAADWARPGRPATDEEIEQMLDECENSPLMTAGEAEQYSKELIEKWSRQRK